MANETATKSQRFYCVSLVPDICKTPIGPSTPPIPYSVVGEFSQAANVSPNVKAHSEFVILHKRSVIPTVKGDEPGKAGGIKSGTFAKKVETKTASKTYFANGTATVQEGCEVWMNDRNTVGKIYERGGAAPRSRLEQIMAMAQDELDEATKEAKAALKPMAQGYKDKLSGTLHDAAADAIDKGGKVIAGGVALTATGAVTTATGVGAPVGAPIAAAGTVTTAAGGAVTAAGAAVEVSATVLDNLADYILTSKTPDLTAMAMGVGQRLLTSLAGSKIPGLSALLQKGKQGTKAVVPRQSQPRPPDKAKGGKTKRKKEKKSDKPSECCPKNKAPGGKPVSSRHPVHFGTGEEVLYQTDFVVDGPIPLPWTRCYRSGSELEDWGLCGARWGMPYTASIATTGKGIIYIDDSGRPMLLPTISVGAVFDNRKEGFALTHCSDTEYLLEWRDGSTDRFVRCPSADSWLPHGFDGVNAMRPASDPLLAKRYTISRSQGRNGRGITVERFPDAEPGQVLLRVRSDGGLVLEAMRYQPRSPASKRAQSICIGRVDEVRDDGTRVCQARYEYATESANEPSHRHNNLPVPERNNLVTQISLAGNARRYCYHHHLLTSYTTYSGFEHTLKWISLAAVREGWDQKPKLTEADLVEHYPITMEDSYQARAIATDTADGLGSVRIAYLDENTTRVTDANGGVLEYEFDANWLAIDVRRIDANGIVNSLGRRIWDKDGMLLEEIDAAGRATRFAYDAAGNLTASTDALGRSSRIEYDGHNQPIAVTDPLGHITRLEYDNHGNMVTQTDALGHVTTYRYDDQGRVCTMIDAQGGAKHVSYDNAGHIAAYTDCSGSRTAFEYERSGRLVAVTDATNATTRYTYDLGDQVIKIEHADGSTEQYEHNPDGGLTAHTDSAGYKTHYLYNGHGLPIERIDALGYSVKYRYDAMLQLIELTNSNENIYYFNYDADGRLTSEVAFDGIRTNYRYDIVGHLVATECNGSSVELLRDGLGQIILKVTDNGSIRIYYDPLGRITTAIAPNARSDFTYDAIGHLIEERSAYFLNRTPEAGAGPACPDAQFLIRRTYDELGNRIQTILPNRQSVDILRYGAGFWHGLLSNGQSIVDIERDALHREISRRFGSTDLVKAAREYDLSSRITRMTWGRSRDQRTEIWLDRYFSYDKGGNLSAIANTATSGPIPAEIYRYEYDPLGQLLTAKHSGLVESFGYDGANNQIRQPHADRGTALAKFHGDRVEIFDGFSYQYDLKGNVSAKILLTERTANSNQQHVFDYDAENRMISSVVAHSHEQKTQSNYFYDAFGRRIGKTVRIENLTDNSNGEDKGPLHQSEETVIYIWDGDLLAQEIAGGLVTTYIYEPDGCIPLAMLTSGHNDESNSNLPYSTSRSVEQIEQCSVTISSRATVDSMLFYCCDHLGTPHELITASGTIKWSSKYFAWGSISDQHPPPDSIAGEFENIRQPIRFPGQYQDSETLLHYSRHRYYDPESGRFTSPDPIGLLGGLNGYTYAPNPTGWIDPLGLKKSCRNNVPCDPCDGKNPSTEARMWQGTKPYEGVDSYRDTVIAKNTTIYALYHPAQGDNIPSYFVTGKTLTSAGWNHQRVHELLQVQSTLSDPSARAPRTLVRAYKLKQSICVGSGKAVRNGKYGSGGGTQMFISEIDKSSITQGHVIGLGK